MKFLVIMLNMFSEPRLFKKMPYIFVSFKTLSVGSVRIYDFASKTPLAQMKFKQGGTALAWVPRLVS